MVLRNDCCWMAETVVWHRWCCPLASAVRSRTGRRKFSSQVISHIQSYTLSRGGRGCGRRTMLHQNWLTNRARTERAVRVPVFASIDSISFNACDMRYPILLVKSLLGGSWSRIHTLKAYIRYIYYYINLRNSHTFSTHRVKDRRHNGGVQLRANAKFRKHIFFSSNIVSNANGVAVQTFPLTMNLVSSFRKLC